MTYEEKIEQLLVTELKELWNLVGKFHCPFCGRQHRSKYHDELHKFYSDADAFNKAYKTFTEKNEGKLPCCLPSDLIPYFPGFDKSLTSENPQEYIPD